MLIKKHTKIKWGAALIGFLYSTGFAAEMVNLEMLKTDINDISQRVTSTRAAYENANSTVVIGPSSHGKSTLITYLAGRPLVAELGDAGFFLRAQDPLPNFNIGENHAVGTRIPTLYYDATLNSVYWDCPGFGDPRGSAIDIVNAYGIQEVFRAPSKVKIAITLRKGDLQGNAMNFAGLLKHITDVFPDSDQLHSCVSLIITNHTPDVNVTGLLNTIHQNAGNNVYFNEPRVKGLVRFLADNPNRVSVFPYPTAVGPYSTGHRQAILNSIRSSQFVRDIANRVAVSPQAQVHVRELAVRMNNTIRDYIHDTMATSFENLVATRIRNHQRTGRELKADCASYNNQLITVRQDSHLNYLEDVQRIMEQIEPELATLTEPQKRTDLRFAPLREVKRNIDIIGSFMSLSPGVEYRVHLWKDTLATLANSLLALSNAPEHVADERKGRFIRQYEVCKDRDGRRERCRPHGRFGGTRSRYGHTGYDNLEYAKEVKRTTTFAAVGNPAEDIVITDNWAEADNQDRSIIGEVIGTTITERSAALDKGWGDWI